MKDLKLFSLLLLIFFSVLNINSQTLIGINTKNAQKIFHIDGAGDNVATGLPTATQLANDVIIDEQGRLGIGLLPQYALDILSTSATTGLKIQDGSEAASKVMTSSNDGTGSWQFVGSLPVISGNLTPAGISIPLRSTLTGSSWVDTNCSLTLPPGKWCVQVSMQVSVGGTLAGDHLWVTSTFENATYMGSSRISGVVFKSGKSFLHGFVIINNTGSTNKTYKYLAGYTEYTGSDRTTTAATLSSFGSITNENSIVAVRLADTVN